MTRLLVFLLLGFWLSGLAHADWQLAREDKERQIRVYTRPVSERPYQSFYAVTRIQARLGAAVAVLADVKAMPEWISRVSEARLLKQKAESEAWIYTAYRLPYPFKPRDTVLHSLLSQDKKSHVVTVTTRSLPDYMARHRDRVRLNTMHSTWKITPEAGGWLKIELWGEGDPEGYMPPWLFNFNLADESIQTFRNLRRMLLRPKYQEQKLAFIREG